MTTGSRNGVTLIELMAVVVIAGLISVTAVMQFSGVVRRAKLQWAVDRLSALEASVRNHSGQHDRSETLSFDVGSGRIERLDEEQTHVVELGQGVAVRRFLSATRSTTAGSSAVEYPPSGHSETYAVRLATASGESAWLLFAGLSGQMTRLENEQHADDILQLIRSEGVHAH